VYPYGPIELSLHVAAAASCSRVTFRRVLSTDRSGMDNSQEALRALRATDVSIYRSLSKLLDKFPEAMPNEISEMRERTSEDDQKLCAVSREFRSSNIQLLRSSVSFRM